VFNFTVFLIKTSIILSLFFIDTIIKINIFESFCLSMASYDKIFDCLTAFMGTLAWKLILI
ncbi:hypothetical protein L6999_003165, partial [Acinetobacter baumannii]